MPSNVSNRIDFSKPTKRIIAGRSGYRCSIPGCERVTIGPGSQPNEVTLNGKASHIFSAAPNGPRGRGGLTDDEIASPQNGIWLCSNHGDLVDKNEGGHYPAPLLFSYKALQEAKISREMQDLYLPKAWFQELLIHQAPVFQSETKARFGKVTMITGDNGTGKTAMWEFLASFGDAAYLERWLPKTEAEKDLQLSVIYHDGGPSRLGREFHDIVW
jgi:hypothetical protein